MQKFININNISGSPDYDIWLCDNPETFCEYIATISSLDLPNYSFDIPFNLKDLSSYILKIEDSNKCQVKITLS